MASLSASIQFTKNPQFTTRITRRTVRLAATASALPQKGKHALTGAWRVPLSKESEADAIFKSHNEFMESTHVVGNAEKDDTSHPRMLEYYISKAKELSEPMDDSSAPTGNLLYTINERYIATSGFEEHMRISNDWVDSPKFFDLAEKYGIFFSVNGTQLTNYADSAEPCLASKNDVNLALGITVPKSQESKLDALLLKHEQFMRDTHVFDSELGGKLSHDDLVQPRLTHFSVNKAQELVDPFDPSKGFTGSVQYSIQETYVTQQGVDGHFNFQSTYPALFEEIVGTFTDPKYIQFADLGQGKVITSMQKSSGMTSNIIGGFKRVLDKVLPRRAPHEEFCEEFCPEEF